MSKATPSTNLEISFDDYEQVHQDFSIKYPLLHQQILVALAHVDKYNANPAIKYNRFLRAKRDKLERSLNKLRAHRDTLMMNILLENKRNADRESSNLPEEDKGSL